MDISDTEQEQYDLENHLLSICTALGGYVEEDGVKNMLGEYIPGHDAQGCLRDLKILFRRYEERGDPSVVSRPLGKWQILQRDLIPILLRKTASKDKEKIAADVIQLMRALTLPVDPKSSDVPGQMEILKGYKEAFTQEGVLQAIMNELHRLLKKQERESRDDEMIGIILTLFRNLLAIKDTQATIGASHETYWKSTLQVTIYDMRSLVDKILTVSVSQERLMVEMEKSEVLQLLLAWTGSMEGKQYGPYAGWKFLLMEIIYHMFKDRDPAHLIEGQRPSVLDELLKEEWKREKKDVRPSSSRHPRFGGTVALQLSNGKQFNVHQTGAALVSVQHALNKDKPRLTFGKAPPKNEHRKKRVISDAEAHRIFCQMAHRFLENSFNDLMISVLEDIRRESPDVTDEGYLRFFYLSSFFLKYQIVLLKGTENNPKPLDFDTVSCMINLPALGTVFKRIRMCKEEKRDKKWVELHIVVDCLKQMLITMDAMYMSENAEHRDLSEELQRELYYAQEALELLVGLVKYNTYQAVSYLESLVETMHILFKMMERYTKENTLIRSLKKRRTKKKKTKQQNEGNEEDAAANADSGSEEEDSPKPEHVEKEIDLQEIEFMFAADAVIATYCNLLQYYRELNDETIHQITVMFHRICVKCKLEAFFFKLSVLDLFNRIMQDKRVMEPTAALKELHQFIKFVLSKFFKRAQDYPLLLIEVLFAKTKADCRRIAHPDEDLRPMPGDKDDADDVVDEDPVDEDELESRPKKAGRPGTKPITPEELVQQDQYYPWEEQVGACVARLKEANQYKLLDWVTESLTEAAALRVQRLPDEDGDVEATNAADYHLRGFSENQKEALESNVVFTRLLSLVKFRKEGETPGVLYSIPAAVSVDDLVACYQLVTEYMNGKRVSMYEEDMKLTKKQLREKIQTRKQEAKEARGASSSEKAKPTGGVDPAIKRKGKKNAGSKAAKRTNGQDVPKGTGKRNGGSKTSKRKKGEEVQKEVQKEAASAQPPLTFLSDSEADSDVPLVSRKKGAGIAVPTSEDQVNEEENERTDSDSEEEADDVERDENMDEANLDSSRSPKDASSGPTDETAANRSVRIRKRRAVPDSDDDKPLAEAAPTEPAAVSSLPEKRRRRIVMESDEE
ncbi:Topoisomerase 1-associated factor 1 [Borealophlyctis nickersoniae]|nr:Topoisomerase 1-associated factor 1 [Borealophlyctis nickersoniae]